MSEGTSDLALQVTGTAQTRGLFELQFRALDHAPLKLTAGRFTLGSDPHCDLIVDVPGVEPQHCLLLVGPRKVVVKALSAKTWIDDGAIRESVLTIGQRLIVGPVDLRLAQAPPETPTMHESVSEARPFAPGDIDEAISTLKESGSTAPPVASLDSIESLLNEYFERHRSIPVVPKEPAVDVQQIVDKELSQARKQLQAQRDALNEQERELLLRIHELEQERTRLDLRQFALNEQQQDVTDRAAAMASDRAAVRKERELLDQRRTQLLEQEDAFQQQIREQRAERLEFEHLQARILRDTDDLKQRERELDERHKTLAALEQELATNRQELDKLRSAFEEQQAHFQQQQDQLSAQLSASGAEKAEIASRQQNLDAREQSLTEHESELLDRESQLRQREAEIEQQSAKLEQQKVTWTVESDELETTLQTREHSLRQQLADLEQRIAEFEESTSTWERECDERTKAQQLQFQQEQERLDALASDLESRSEIDASESTDNEQIEQLKSDLQATTCQLEETRAEFFAQVQKLQLELSERNRELQQLQQSASQEAANALLAASHDEELVCKNAELEQQLEELERSREQLEHQLSEFESRLTEFERVKSRCSELEEQCQQHKQLKENDDTRYNDLQQQLEATARKLDEISHEHETALLEQQDLIATNESLKLQLQEFERASSEQPSIETEIDEIASQSTTGTTDFDSASQSHTSVLSFLHQEEEASELEDQDANGELVQVHEPVASDVHHEEETEQSTLESGQELAETANEPLDSPVAHTSSTSSDSHDPSARSLRSQLAEMFGLPENQTHQSSADSGETEPQSESDETWTDRGPSEQRFDSIMAATRSHRTSHQPSTPTPEPSTRALEPESAPQETATTETQQAQTSESGNPDDSVAAYMEQLLARMRRGNSGDSSSSSESHPQPAPVAPTPPATPTNVASVVEQEQETHSSNGDTSNEAAERPATRQLNPEEKEAMRANLDSFRQLANASARTAVATSQSTRMRGRFRTSLYLSTATWAVSALLLSSEHWSDQSQQLPGLMLMLVAAGMSCWTFLTWIRIKQSQQATSPLVEATQVDDQE